VSDDFDEIIDEFKKIFNVDSDAFEVDFLFIPESGIDLKSYRNEKKVKGFKISYHFETGMEKPEIKIEGIIDERKIREQLKGIDLKKYPNLKNILESKVNEIDATTLSLDFPLEKNDSSILEPYTEIIDKKNYSEIILEIPGMEQDDIQLEFNENGNQLKFTVENGERRYSKIIFLPFKSSKVDCELEVNNGIAILKASKTKSNK
jgi:HSP20 family molecular chaperone IbpA